MIIQKTKNYEKFKNLIVNRNSKSYQKLLASVLERNMLETKPIHVDKDFCIIDGQHRLQVAKELGCEIYYVIDQDASAHDIILLNANQKNWVISDYLNFFEKSGNGEYVAVKKFMDCYDIPISFIVSTFSSCDHKNANFKKGLFKFNMDKEKVGRHLQRIQDLITASNTAISRKFQFRALYEAFFKMVTEPKYDHKTFLHKIKIYPKDVEKSIVFREAVSIYDSLKKNVYNKSSKEDKCLE